MSSALMLIVHIIIVCSLWKSIISTLLLFSYFIFLLFWQWHGSVPCLMTSNWYSEKIPYKLCLLCRTQSNGGREFLSYTETREQKENRKIQGWFFCLSGPMYNQFGSRVRTWVSGFNSYFSSYCNVPFKFQNFVQL